MRIDNLRGLRQNKGTERRAEGPRALDQRKMLSPESRSPSSSLHALLPNSEMCFLPSQPIAQNLPQNPRDGGTGFWSYWDCLLPGRSGHFTECLALRVHSPATRGLGVGRMSYWTRARIQCGGIQKALWHVKYCEMLVVFLLFKQLICQWHFWIYPAYKLESTDVWKLKNLISHLSHASFFYKSA